jgi:hypothetical protein
MDRWMDGAWPAIRSTKFSMTQCLDGPSGQSQNQKPQVTNNPMIRCPDDPILSSPSTPDTIPVSINAKKWSEVET